MRNPSGLIGRLLLAAVLFLPLFVQTAAAQTRADTFVPGKDKDLPQPAFLEKLKLNGISGTRRNPLAIL